MAKISDRSFQMLARYLPGSGAGVDPLSSPGILAKHKGDFSKMVPPKLQEDWEAFRDEIGRSINTYAKFVAKYPGGKRS